MPTITRQQDSTGRWYQDIPGRGRVYDSPAAYGEAPPPGGGGAFHKRTTWDQDTGQWDQGIDWGKIYGYGIGGLLGVNAGTAIAQGIGGGAGGAAETGVTTGPTLAQAAGTGGTAAATSGAGAGMGLTTSDYIKLLAGLGGGALQGALAPRPHSFSGSGAMDPVKLGNSTVDKLNGAYGQAQKAIGNGVHLRSSYVQSPPSFDGPDMPMPMGVTAHDPALDDPSLLSLNPPESGPPPQTTSPTLRPPSQPGQGGDHEQALAAFRLLGMDV